MGPINRQETWIETYSSQTRAPQKTIIWTRLRLFFQLTGPVPVTVARVWKDRTPYDAGKYLQVITKKNPKINQFLEIQIPTIAT